MIQTEKLSGGIARSPGDPTVIQSGPGTKGPTEHLVRGLGWFSVAIGIAELVAPRRITRALGMEGQEGLVRAYGARELGAARLCLSVDTTVGAWSRVAGDVVDIVTLLTAFKDGNAKKRNVGTALLLVAGITLLDLLAAQALVARNSRRSAPRSYGDRSGFPQGVSEAKGSASELAGSMTRPVAASGANLVLVPKPAQPVRS